MIAVERLSCLGAAGDRFESGSRNRNGGFTRILSCVIALGLGAHISHAAEISEIKGSAIPEGEEGIVYKESGGQQRRLEVNYPPGHDPSARRVPGVLLFHGGAWKGGTRDQLRSWCKYLAGRGLVAATADYQLKAGKAACVTDAKSAIRWMKSHADELGIDPERLILGGSSAGGHIALLASITPGINDPGDPQDLDTSAVAYILLNPAFAEKEKDPNVDATKQIKPGLAPAIVFFGDQDDWLKGWRMVQKILVDTGNTNVQFWIAEGQKHGFLAKQPWNSLTTAAADRFLVSLGLLEEGAPLLKVAGSEKLVPGPDIGISNNQNQ